MAIFYEKPNKENENFENTLILLVWVKMQLLPKMLIMCVYLRAKSDKTNPLRNTSKLGLMIK